MPEYFTKSCIVILYNGMQQLAYLFAREEFFYMYRSFNERSRQFGS